MGQKGEGWGEARVQGGEERGGNAKEGKKGKGECHVSIVTRGKALKKRSGTTVQKGVRGEGVLNVKGTNSLHY